MVANVKLTQDMSRHYSDPPLTASATANAFAVAGPKARNQLLVHLLALETVGPFKMALKTLSSLHPVTVPSV